MSEINISNESLILFKGLSQTLDDYLFLCDLETDISIWSESAIKEFDLPSGYVHGMDKIWVEKIHPDDREKYIASIDDVFLNGSQKHGCEYRALNRYGEYVWLRCIGYILNDGHGRRKYFVGSIVYMGAQNKIDVVTSLFSVYEFYNDVKQLIEEKNKKGGILFFDIDDFKTINNRYSFTFGNNVLKSFANVLTDFFGNSARLYRLDGDKFAVLMLDADVKSVEQCFDDVLTIAANTEINANKPVSFTVSGGGCMFPEDGKKYDVLYKNLECALSKSKQNGKKRLTMFSNDLLEVYLHKVEMIEELKASIRDGYKGFELYYQPLFTNSDGRLYGCEALLRWHNDKFPNVGPMEFVPLLEDSGYIIEVGRWVLETACAQIKEWRDIVPDLRVNINASYKQFENQNFKEELVKVLNNTSLPPDAIILELTEGCKINDLNALKHSLMDIRESGVKVALDDFGTGYASMDVLRDVTTDWVKIEHSFVSKIMNNTKDRVIIKHIISLCSALGIVVCVEGIENYEICNTIREFAPDILQGYYYSVPVPVQEFEEQFL